MLSVLLHYLERLTYLFKNEFFFSEMYFINAAYDWETFKKNVQTKRLKAVEVK